MAERRSRWTYAVCGFVGGALTGFIDLPFIPIL